MNLFTLSIETTVGNCHQYGFHIGTDEKLARQIAKATHLIKGIDSPFPTDLVESERRLTFKVPKAFKVSKLLKMT